MGERAMVFFKNKEGQLSKSLYTQWGGPHLASLVSDFVNKKENLVGKFPNKVLVAFAKWYGMGEGEHIRDTYEEETNLDHGNWRVEYDEVSGNVISFKNLDTDEDFDSEEASNIARMY